MELLPIGYFSKTHGVKGQMVLKANRDFARGWREGSVYRGVGRQSPLFYYRY